VPFPTALETYAQWSGRTTWRNRLVHIRSRMMRSRCLTRITVRTLQAWHEWTTPRGRRHPARATRTRRSDKMTIPAMRKFIRDETPSSLGRGPPPTASSRPSLALIPAVRIARERRKDRESASAHTGKSFGDSYAPVRVGAGADRHRWRRTK